MSGLSGVWATKRRSGPPGLLRDALFTVLTRFGLAILILLTDVALARLLGPAAKGRFVLVLLYSQLAAVIVSWGMDAAGGVLAGRDRATARRAFGNAVAWSLLVGGLAVLASLAAYGVPAAGQPAGPLARVIPNLSGAQFLYAALALPGEIFFAVGLFALLGRQKVIAYGTIRILRRGLLLVLFVAAAAIARLSLDVALVLNLATLAASAAAIAAVAWRDGTFRLLPDPRLLVEQLRFGSRAVFGTLAERLQFRADAFLLNLFMGVSATGVYSVTSGLAETLWYIPNALGTVMFSRAVDPGADAGRVAAVLTRTTLAVTLAAALPAFLLGPWLVEAIYGAPFREAGDALRWILPGVVLYSVVAVLSRYVVGRGRPGTGALVLGVGLGANVALNLVLIPRLGIVGAAAASSLSYGLTALLTLVLFRRLSGRGALETLVLRRADLRALGRTGRAAVERLAGRRRGPLVGLRGGDAAATLVIEEREPGEEL